MDRARLTMAIRPNSMSVLLLVDYSGRQTDGLTMLRDSVHPLEIRHNGTRNSEGLSFKNLRSFWPKGFVLRERCSGKQRSVLVAKRVIGTPLKNLSDMS